MELPLLRRSLQFFHAPLASHLFAFIFPPLPPLTLAPLPFAEHKYGQPLRLHHLHPPPSPIKWTLLTNAHIGTGQLAFPGPPRVSTIDGRRCSGKRGEINQSQGEAETLASALIRISCEMKCTGRRGRGDPHHHHHHPRTQLRNLLLCDDR